MPKLTFEHVRLGLGSSLAVMNCTNDQSCKAIGWHIHPEYEIVYVRNGSGRLHIATKHLSYDDGVLLFLGPDIPHTDFGNNEQPDAMEVVVQFTPAFVQEKLAVFPEFAAIRKLIGRSGNVLRFGKPLRAKLDAVFVRLAAAGPTGKLLGTLEVLQAMATAAVHEVEELFVSPVATLATKPRDTARLERVFAFVSDQYAQRVSSADAAAHVGLTTNAFCRFFRRQTGRSFVDFLNAFRIERAQDLLMHSSVSVREAMYATGFRDPAYFSKVFRRYVGGTPSAVRPSASL